MRDVGQDLKYALRQLRRSPGFTSVAVLTLALGIGANTAIFSVVNGVLLNPLPFPQSDQLVAIHENKPNFEGGSVSYPNFRDWQKENRTFSAMAVARPYAFSLTGTGQAEQVTSQYVSSDFFPLLGVNPLMGRTFAPEEDQIGAAPLALVSEGFWKRKLGSESDVLGKSLTLDGKQYTIVGVIPASFHLTIPSFTDSEVYVAIGQWNNNLLTNRGAGLGIHGIGRLKPGITIEQARADMDTVTRALAAAYPDTDKGISAKLVPLKSQMVGRARPFLLLLLAAVAFVLLIGWVNVANLLLARSTARAREFAIRVAMGAGQGRLLRQLLTESVLLAMAGGALGLLLAQWGTRAALGVLPAALPRAEEIGLDARVLIFTAVISLVVGILFGLAPALKAGTLDLQQTLKEAGWGASRARNRTQDVSVVIEVALTLVLLIGAGLMIRSLIGLWNVDPGFNPQNALTFSISLPPTMMNAKPDAIRAAFREVDRQMAAAPGVRTGSLIWGAFPMSGDDEWLFWLDGHAKPATENEMNWAIDYIVGPDYLKTMGIPLRQGRYFTVHDDERSPHVAVIDDVFARKYFPDQNPIGKRVNFNNFGQAEIIGVVGHVKQWGLDLDDAHSLRAQVYVPWMQMSDRFVALSPSGSGYVVRSDGKMPASAVFAAVRRASEQMSAAQVIFGEQTMDQIISISLAARRFLMIVLATFAALALVLSSVGVYGVISCLVARRTQEIGIRMALGADRTDVARLVLRDGLRLAAIGVGIGILCSLALTRLMSKWLFAVSTTDPITFLSVSVLLLFVATAACYLPARSAMQVDPITALRYD